MRNLKRFVKNTKLVIEFLNLALSTVDDSVVIH